MIQNLQRLRAKKGFTIIELIVVIAIMAVLMAIIVPSMSTHKAKVNAANSAARDFYSAVQAVMTKYSLYEGPLSPQYSVNADLGDMRYYEKLGGNYPYKKGTTAGDIPETTSLYIELVAKNGNVGDIVTYAAVSADTGYDDGQGMYELCKRDSDCVNTEFARLFREEIEDRIDYQDGYYYAKITYKQVLTGTIPTKMEVETVKVDYTGYSKTRMPKATADFTTFKNENMYFGDDYVLNNGEIFGVCTSYNSTTGTIMGIAGTAIV